MKKLILFLSLLSCQLFGQDTISTTNDTINSGGSVVLTDIVNTSYLWSTGDTTKSISINPISDTTVYCQRIVGTDTSLSYKTIYVSNSYDPDAVIYFQVCSTAGAEVTPPYKTRYNNYIVYLKNHGKWYISDSRYVWATGNEIWAKIDIRNPSRSVTLKSSYAGRFTIDRGWNGNNSFAMLSNFNPGDGGTYNFIDTNASIGCLVLNNNSVASKIEISCFNTAITQGIAIQSFPNGRVALNSVSNPTSSYLKYRFNSYCWIGNHRTSSTDGRAYVNGVNTQTQTQTSTAIENKNIAIMGGYNGAWMSGYYTPNSHAVFYAGSGELSQAVEMAAYNYAFNYGNRTNITNRIIFEGDSRAGDALQANYSNNSAYPKAVLVGLGDGWSGSLVSKANETASQVDAQYVTEIQPYRDTNLVNDVIYLFIGTNSLATGQTGAQVYANIISFCTKAKTDGFKVVVFGEIDRNWSNYSVMNAERESLRSLMLAEYPTTVSTNIYSGGIADYYVDLFGEPNFQNYSAGWMQVDGVHPNTTGSNVIGVYGVTAGGFFN